MCRKSIYKWCRNPRKHFDTGAEVSRIFTVVPKCPMDTSAPMLNVLGPKCLRSDVPVHQVVECTESTIVPAGY